MLSDFTIDLSLPLFTYEALKHAIAILQDDKALRATGVRPAHTSVESKCPDSALI